MTDHLKDTPNHHPLEWALAAALQRGSYWWIPGPLWWRKIVARRRRANGSYPWGRR